MSDRDKSASALEQEGWAKLIGGDGQADDMLATAAQIAQYETDLANSREAQTQYEAEEAAAAIEREKDAAIQLERQRLMDEGRAAAERERHEEGK